MIVALVGMPASGKGEASKIFQEYGFKLAHMRSVVEAAVKEKGLKPTAKNMVGTGAELRRKEGQGAVARRLLPRIAGMNGNICIEGVRDAGELKVFRERLRDFVAVAFVAPPGKRYERSLARGRSDDIRSYQEFLKKDRKEREWGIDEAVEMADYRIVNDSDLEAFRKRVHEVVEKILKSGGFSNSAGKE